MHTVIASVVGQGCENISHIFHVMFEDKRLSAALLMVWLAVVLYTFSHLGLFNTQFMSLGPSEETYFMGVQLATWPKWSLVAIFTFVSTAINDFVGDSLFPFITNTIQDHKTRYIPYSKFTCWAITQTLAIYSCTMSIFSIYLLLSQLDFMLIRMFADSLVNIYTMRKFMKHKKVSRARYEEHNKSHTVDTEPEYHNEDTVETHIETHVNDMDIFTAESCYYTKEDTVTPTHKAQTLPKPNRNTKRTGYRNPSAYIRKKILVILGKNTRRSTNEDRVYMMRERPRSCEYGSQVRIPIFDPNVQRDDSDEVTSLHSV